MNLLERQLEDPVRFARIKRVSIMILVVVALSEILRPMVFADGHSHFAFEDFPGWGSIYGFVSCVAIIIVSKLIGTAWLMRREDHYDD